MFQTAHLCTTSPYLAMTAEFAHFTQANAFVWWHEEIGGVPKDTWSECILDMVSDDQAARDKVIQRTIEVFHGLVSDAVNKIRSISIHNKIDSDDGVTVLVPPLRPSVWTILRKCALLYHTVCHIPVPALDQTRKVLDPRHWNDAFRQHNYAFQQSVSSGVCLGDRFLRVLVPGCHCHRHAHRKTRR